MYQYIVNIMIIKIYYYFCGIIEFYGIRFQGNYRVDQGQIFVFQMFYVTYYVGFRVVFNNIYFKFLNEYRCNIENKIVNLCNNWRFFA